MVIFKKIYNSPTIMSWASNFVRFGSLIFVIPLVLTRYDSLEQSLWFITNTIIGFAMLADSGFGSVIVRAVAYFKAGAISIPRTKEEFETTQEFENREPNLQMLHNLLTTTNIVYFFLAILVIILLSTGGVAFVWNIMKLSDHRPDFWLAFFLLIPYCVVTINSVKWNSFMKGLSFVALDARFKAMTSCFRIAFFTILLLLNAKPVALIAVMLVEAVVINNYMRRIVLKWFKENNAIIEKRRVFNKELFWSIWPATWKLAGLFWGGYLISQGNSIIMAQITDTRLMAAFLFTSRIVTFLKTIAQTPFYANIPTIYKYAAQKKFDELRTKSSQQIFLGLFIFIAGSLFIIFFGNLALEVINSDTRFISTELLLLLSLTLILDLHSTFHASIYTSTNHIPFLLPAVISGALVVIIGFLILPVYGLLGILMVRFLIELAFNNWYTVHLSLKLLKWPLIQYMKEMPKYGVLFIKEKVLYFNPLKQAKNKNTGKKIT